MTVDPRYSFWLSVFLAVLGVLAGSATQFSNLGLSAHTVQAILAIIVLLNGVGNAVNAILAAIPSRDTNDPAEAKKFLLGPKATS